MEMFLVSLIGPVTWGIIILGAIALLRRKPQDPGATMEARIKLLEDQVQWLYGETRRFREQLAEARRNPGVPDPSPDAVAPAPSEVPPEPIKAPARATGAPVIAPPELNAPAPPKSIPAPVASHHSTPGTVDAAPEPSPLARFFAGNPLAKIGVVLLFFALASALRLAADMGLLPMPVRLGAGALLGLGLIGLGWRQVRLGLRRPFGLALQGGGIAILYLVVYFMLSPLGYLTAPQAFIGFALLGVACLLLAVVQNGQALAVLGLAGAFLAPVLAGGHSDTPLPLFAYFTLLNVILLATTWRKPWPVVNHLGLLLTLAVSGGWAMDRYESQHQTLCQGFLALMWALYSLVPTLSLRTRAAGAQGWRQGWLIFGVPALGLLLQVRLTPEPDALLLPVVVAGFYHAVLGLLLRRADDPEAPTHAPMQGQFAVAVSLFTLAIPLHFGVFATATLWVLEGVGLIWFGTIQGRRLPQLGGLLVQCGAGAYLASSLVQSWQGSPFLHAGFLEAVAIALGGLASAWIMHRGESDDPDRPLLPALPPLAWGMVWWLIASLGEIARVSASDHLALGVLLCLTLTLWACNRLSLHLRGDGVESAWPALDGVAWLPAVLLGISSLAFHLTSPGPTLGLPYLPLLNAFDLLQVGALFALAQRLSLGEEEEVSFLGSIVRYPLLAALAFVGATCLMARLAHHGLGVPFEPDALWHSVACQALVTLLWTLLAIAAMIRATRVGLRRLWQGGFALLCLVGLKLMAVDLANAGTLVWTGSLLGVALLVLAASYFAPVPPEE